MSYNHPWKRVPCTITWTIVPIFTCPSPSRCVLTHKSSDAQSSRAPSEKECVIMVRYRRRRQVDCIDPAHSWRTGASYNQTLCTVSHILSHCLAASECLKSGNSATPYLFFLTVYLPTSVLLFDRFFWEFISIFYKNRQLSIPNKKTNWSKLMMLLASCTHGKKFKYNRISNLLFYI